MPGIGSTSDTVSAIIERAETPTITNKALPTAGAEVTHALQAGVKKIEFQARGDSTIKFSFVSGQSGTNYFTLHKGSGYAIDGLKLSGTTLYVQANKNNEILEILEWV